LLKLFAKMVLVVIGLAFGLFSLFLASVGAVRLHGWSVTGRLAPPNYPGLERFDIISFAAEPLRAAMEIGGNAFLVVINLCGLVALILTLRRGLTWIQNWPASLPLILVVVFWTTVAATVVGRTDWTLPASVLFGAAAVGIDWVILRRRGLSISARVSDVVARSPQTSFGLVQMSGRANVAIAALLALLAMLKVIASFG